VLGRYQPKHRVPSRWSALPTHTQPGRHRPRHLDLASRRAANRAYTSVAVLVTSIGLAATTTYGFGPTPVSAQQVVVAGSALASRSNAGVSVGEVPGSVRLRRGSVTSSVRSPSDAYRPAFVRIGSIGTTSALVNLGLKTDGSLEVPADFGVAGWYAGGPAPGEPGAAVIAGHYDSYVGPAVFAKLKQVKPGDNIDVTREDGEVLRFVVERIDRYPKDYFPNEQVYGATVRSELRLITCGGTFDRKKGSYNDNIVVYATLDTP
jgi:hypothetical protein